MAIFMDNTQRIASQLKTHPVFQSLENKTESFPIIGKYLARFSPPAPERSSRGRAGNHWKKKPSFHAGMLAEAAWLLAVGLTPLFFNPFSIRCFEPEKAAVIIGCAILAGCAWLWHRIYDTRRDTCGVTPIHQGVKAVIITITLSSLLSISPMVSFAGSYDRAQGLFLLLAWAILFMAITEWMRTPFQLERILRVMLFASIPVCVYALIQKAGLDPMPWADDVVGRCAGTLGNPIFLGAYISILLPITAIQIFRARSRTLYAGIFVLQLVTLAMSGSRGPLIGGMAGLIFFSFLFLRVKSRGRPLIMLSILSLLAFSFWTTRPELSTSQGCDTAFPCLFGRLLDPTTPTVRIRLVTWRSVTELVMPHAPLEFPDGTHDRLNWLRPLIGYGPECLGDVFDPFYPAELGRLENKSAIPDRAHNETWDTLATTGWLGLASLWGLYLAIFYTGLKRLNLARHRRDASVFLACCLGGALTGTALLSIWKGLALAGPGFSLGILGGVPLYLVWTSSRVVSSSEVSPSQLLVMALLSGICAHIVEVQFGFATVTTRTLFWAYAALLALPNVSVPSDPERQPPFSGWKRMIGAVLVGTFTVLATILCLRPLYANRVFTKGLHLLQAQNIQGAILEFQEAVRWAPYEERYRTALGKSHFLLANQPNHDNDRHTGMERALADLRRAQSLKPFQAERAANLGGLYAGWAALTDESERRQILSQQADAYYAQALRINPHRGNTWNERAQLHMNVTYAPALVERYLQEALALDMNDPRTHELLGVYHERLGYEATNPSERVRHLDLALEHYEWRDGLSAEKRAAPVPWILYFHMATLSLDLGKLDDRDIWVPHTQFRGLPIGEDPERYRRRTHRQHALRYAQQALRLAPGDKQDEIERFIAALNKEAVAP